MKGDAEAKAQARREEQREEKKQAGAVDDTDLDDDGPDVHATMDGPEKPRYEPDKLQAAWVGGSEYAIWSERNGTMNAYEVDLTDLSCTCEHGEHNRHTTEACGHIRKAIKCHHSNPNLEHSMILEYARNLRDANEIVWKARDALGSMRSAQEAYESGVANGDTPGASSPVDTDDDSPGARQAEAEGAAERLQEAYDNTIEDMQVKAAEGIVWVQTGQETPDDWPHPGGSSTWEVLLKNPEQVQYVGEGGDDYDAHKWFDKKPGEWWKNAIDTEDVDDYIDEVLG